MMEGLEIVFRQYPTGRTLHFINAHRGKLVKRLNLLGQKEPKLNLESSQVANVKFSYNSEISNNSARKIINPSNEELKLHENTG